MLKAALRKKYKELRSKLSEGDIEDLSIEIANKLLQIDIWQFTYYHIFLPIEDKKEINTEFILNILAGKDKEIVIPKSDFVNNSLSHFLLTDNTVIKKNRHNIPEPVDGLEVPVSKIQVVFIPLLAFDSHGNRIGYGKGFYDTFLADCEPETIKIGLSFFEAENKIEDLGPLDIPLDYCATPKRVYKFTH